MRAYELFEGSEVPFTKAQMDFIIHTLSNRPVDELEFETVYVSNLYTIIEKSSNVIVYQTPDEDDADHLCDEFNQDKDIGKDALVQSLITNRKKYQI